MQPDADADAETEADLPHETQLGTQAASPRAIAEVATGSRATELQGAPPSRGSTSSGRSLPAAAEAEALDRSDLSRMRAFHTFGVIAPVGAILLSLLLGGDPATRIAFWLGAGLLSACNVLLVYLTKSEASYKPRPVGILWIISTLGVLPALAYFGPFSAAVMVLMLGIVFIALGRVRWTALATAGICIGGHVAIALPIILGWTRDRGVLTSQYVAQTQLWAAELLVVGFLIARRAGVVHRDLKPHNLFFHGGATWKILDFGVSKVLGSEGTLTGDGIVGTPQYMAPEQASGGEVTHLADVYALGAVAYRCLTGRSPFKGRELAELVYQVVHRPPLRPGALGRVPSLLEDVLAVAMAKDPRRRFPSAHDFAQAFIAARRGRPVAISPPPNAWS